MHGHDAETRKMINEREPGDGDAFEDHSELLSMQVETYMDIKWARILCLDVYDIKDFQLADFQHLFMISL